jgi:hypothetical protein
MNSVARFTFDGDKLPAESGVKPPHSKACGDDLIKFLI